MGYIMPAFPKSHFYESRKIAEERIADLRVYFIELLKCEFCRACLPLKDFLLTNEHDEIRHDLFKAEKHKERKDAQGRIGLEIGAPVAANEYVLEKDWDPSDFDTMKNLLPAMKQGDVRYFKVRRLLKSKNYTFRKFSSLTKLKRDGGWRHQLDDKTCNPGTFKQIVLRPI